MLPPSSGLQAKKPQVPSRWPWRCVVRSSKGLKPGPKVDGNDCESIEINFLLMLWIRRRDNILMMLHHVLRAYSSNTRSLFILSLSLLWNIYICIIVSYIMYYNVYIYISAEPMLWLFHILKCPVLLEEPVLVKTSVFPGHQQKHQKATNKPCKCQRDFLQKKTSSKCGHMCFPPSTWIEATGIAGDARSLEDFGGFFSGGEV